jgi:hypothetical protein
MVRYGGTATTCPHGSNRRWTSPPRRQPYGVALIGGRT